MNVTVMRFVVNGSGESEQANIGISLSGTGEHPVELVYVDGRKTVNFKGENEEEDFCDEKKNMSVIISRTILRQNSRAVNFEYRLFRRQSHK